MLVTGGTGIGKTVFSEAFLNAMYGIDWAYLQVDASLDMNKLRNIDFETIRNGSGTLADAVKETKFLTASAVLVDEFNRAIPEQTSILHGWLTNGAVGLEGGKTFNTGKEVNGGGRYQFKIATINEGSGYTGTKQLDMAARARFAVELNLDIFQQSDVDARAMLMDTNKFAPPEAGIGAGVAKEVFQLHVDARRLPLDTIVEELFVYMTKMNNCIRSPEGTKMSIETFNEQYCSGCHANAQYHEACANFHAPSPRVLRDLMAFSKAFAAYRMHKLPNTPNTVTLDDVNAVGSFVVTAEKLGINRGWVHQFAEDSGYNATKEALKLISLKFVVDSKAMIPFIDSEARGTKLGKDDVQKLGTILRGSPWAARNRDELRTLYNETKTATEAQKASKSKSS